MKKISIILLVVALSVNLYAQNDEKLLIKQKREKSLLELKSDSTQQYKDYYKAVHKRKPSFKEIDSESNKSVNASRQKVKKSSLELPADIIYPAEFEEVQAIMMTWPYITKTVAKDELAEQMFENKGFPYTSSIYKLEPVYSVPDISNNETTKLFSKLADGIQKNAQVWINTWNADDSTVIKEFMSSNNMPLTNYRFFVNQGNSFWYRDCGPVAFYYGDNDDIAFMDFEYYGGRPLDDKLPIKIADELGYPVFTSTIEYEGGNILVDGLGSLFTTDAVYSLNKDTYGLYFETDNEYGYAENKKTSLTNQQVRDSLTYLMNLKRIVVLPSLKYDGGTGHIDLYTDLSDENTFVTTKHPNEMASLSDPKIVESNLDSLTKLNAYSPEAKNYYNIRIPLPTKDNGAWYSSQQEYNNYYTRSYSNHTFVNKSIMQPVFYNQTSGDIDGNKAAIDTMKLRYNGYDFVEIDVRDFDGYGGAIHCITKQIPAENPIRIYHYPVHSLNTAKAKSTSFTITAIVQNKSGIENASLYYRRKGESNWSELGFASKGDNLYQALMPINQDASMDTIEYYISATSNNGKTITKPITAPNGYYTMVYGKDVSEVSLKDIEMMSLNVGEFYPNPSQYYSVVNLSKPNEEDINVRVISIKGQVVKEKVIKKGQTQLEISTSDMNPGVYWVMIGRDSGSVVRKLVVVR